MTKRPISVIEVLDSTILQDKENIARYKKDKIPGVKLFEDKLLKDQQFEDEIYQAFNIKDKIIVDPTDTVITRTASTVKSLGFVDYNHYINDLEDRIYKTTGIKKAVGWEDAVNYLKQRVKQYGIYGQNIENSKNQGKQVVPYISLPPPAKIFVPEKVTLQPLPEENQNSIFTAFNPLTRTDNPDGNLEKIKVEIKPVAEGIKQSAAVTGNVVKVLAPAARELLLDIFGAAIGFGKDVADAVENWDTIKYVLIAGVGLFIVLEGKQLLE